MSRKKILVVTRHTPLPSDDGAGAYLTEILRSLKLAGYQIELLWLQPHSKIIWQGLWRLPNEIRGLAIYRLSGAIKFASFHFFPGIYWYPLKARLLHGIKKIFHFLSLSMKPRRNKAKETGIRPWISEPSETERQLFKRHFLRIKPDIICINYAMLMPLLDELPLQFNPKRLCITHDVMTERAQLLENKPDQVTEEKERQQLNRSDIIAAISSKDAQSFGQMNLSTKIVVVPKPTTVCRLPPSVQKRILFVGSNGPLNREGIQWFLTEVWPIFLTIFPDYQLDICGSVGSSLATNQRSVAIHNQVPSLKPFYAAAKLVVIPLLSATGTNIKLIEAAAHQRPIVSTPVALRGASQFEGTVLAADTPDSFASSMSRILADPEFSKRIAQNSANIVERDYCPCRCTQELVQMLN